MESLTAGQKAARTRKARAAARLARRQRATLAAAKAQATRAERGHRYVTGYMQSIDFALGQFCGAPSSTGELNGEIVERVMGASIAKPSALDTVDPAIFDAVSTRSGKACRTFREAFSACCTSSTASGHRYWQDLDLRTLQDCHPDFRAFRLPEWVEQQIVERQLADHYAELSEDYVEHDISDAARGPETLPF